MHETHPKGLLGELEFTLKLVKDGWNILKPADQNSRYDLVIERNGEFKKVQIKYCTPKNGIVRLELDKPRRKTLPYSLSESDYMGAYNSRDCKFYLVPLREFGKQKEIWLRIDPPRNNQSKNVRFAKEFEI